MQHLIYYLPNYFINKHSLSRMIRNAEITQQKVEKIENQSIRLHELIEIINFY